MDYSQHKKTFLPVYCPNLLSVSYQVFQSMHTFFSYIFSSFPFPSAILPDSLLSQSQLYQHVPTNSCIHSIWLYLTRCLTLEHLQVIPTGHGLLPERQRSCISWLSEINTQKKWKTYQETFINKVFGFLSLNTYDE